MSSSNIPFDVFGRLSIDLCWLKTGKLIRVIPDNAPLKINIKCKRLDCQENSAVSVLPNTAPAVPLGKLAHAIHRDLFQL